MKLPHHASRGNVTKGLLKAVTCKRFAISTDGSRHEHPHPEAIARVVSANRDRKELYFNYRNEEAVMWDDPRLRTVFSYDCHFAREDAMGRLKISI
ncbi:hypothetical protein E0H70_28100 [Rhizobium leguminosarum bv. viciae]|nr:hypothetical protein E0H70_28100 [Rhizobium leguminosarum bv. viciae]